MTEAATESHYRDADNWISEIVAATTLQDSAEDWNEWTGEEEEPEGLVHIYLRNGEALQYYLAQRMRWKITNSDDDIVKYRYLTEEELDEFVEVIRPSAEMAEKASRFVNDFYRELRAVNEHLEKKGMNSGTLSMVMNFSLNCSLTESGTLANMSGSDMRRIANELMAQSITR